MAAEFLSFFLPPPPPTLHLGCFAFTATTNTHSCREKPTKGSKTSRLSHFKPHKKLSSSWSYVKRIFSKTKTYKDQPPSTLTTLSSTRSLQRFVVNQAPTESIPSMAELPPRNGVSDICPDNNNSPSIFPLYIDIFPCTACGEIFQKSQLLEQHLAIKHSVSELNGEDSSKNIANIMSKTGSIDKEKSQFLSSQVAGSKSLFDDHKQVITLPRDKDEHGGSIVSTKDMDFEDHAKFEFAKQRLGNPGLGEDGRQTWQKNFELKITIAIQTRFARGIARMPTPIVQRPTNLQFP